MRTRTAEINLANLSRKNLNFGEWGDCKFELGQRSNSSLLKLLSHSLSLWTSDLLVDEDSVEVTHRGDVIDSFNERKEEKADLKGLSISPSNVGLKKIMLLKSE